ncbi:MAG: TraX family protein [Alphaproteobacteria bacterium]
MPVFKKLTKYGPVNSHDLIKVFALVFMTIDHCGIYLLPEDLWWRAVGRIGVPVWFFLIGYARGDRITHELISGAAILLLASAVTGVAILPLHALVTIIFCRLALNFMCTRGWLERYPSEVIALCLLFFLPSIYLFEYGTLAIGFAFAGRMLREGMQGARMIAIWVSLSVFFVVMQLANYDFNLAQSALVSVGTALVCWYLYRFRITSVRLPPITGVATLLLARYSLEYYVAHRVLFQVIGAYVLGNWPIIFRWL